MTIGAQFDEHLARLGEEGREKRRERAIAALTAAQIAAVPATCFGNIRINYRAACASAC